MPRKLPPSVTVNVAVIERLSKPPPIRICFLVYFASVVLGAGTNLDVFSSNLRMRECGIKYFTPLLFPRSSRETSILFLFLRGQVCEV